VKARMKSPAVIIPDAMTAIRSLNEAIQQGGVPPRTLDLVHLRTSQINGCSVCLGAAVKARKDGETEERLFTLSAWRWIATVNVFNRVNVATRQVPGQWPHQRPA
jgi:AhpD family alkylhydroperoxidase